MKSKRQSKCAPEAWPWRLIVNGCLAVAMSAGCSSGRLKSAELQDLQPVRGEVSVDGKPAVGATVRFVKNGDDPKSFKKMTFATVAADGSFELRSAVGEGSKPGAQPGDYAVAISWKLPINPDDKDDSEMGPELVPEKYTDIATSGLTYSVKPGKNEIPRWDLTP